MKQKREVTAKKIYSYAFKMQVVQEYDNGQFIDAMHHLKICIHRPVWVFFPEVISQYFFQVEVITWLPFRQCLLGTPGLRPAAGGQPDGLRALH